MRRCCSPRRARRRQAAPAARCARRRSRSRRRRCGPEAITPGLNSSDNDAATVSAGAVRPIAPAAAKTATTRRKLSSWDHPGRGLRCQPTLPTDLLDLRRPTRPNSELQPHRKFRLPRRRVDVGEQRRARAEQRPAATRRCALPMLLFGVEKFARSKMLNSCAMNSARAGRRAEEFREPQIDVGKARTIDLVRPASGCAARPELVDRVEIQRPATRQRHHARRKIRVRG